MNIGAEDARSGLMRGSGTGSDWMWLLEWMDLLEVKFVYVFPDCNQIGIGQMIREDSGASPASPASPASERAADVSADCGGRGAGDSTNEDRQAGWICRSADYHTGRPKQQLCCLWATLSAPAFGPSKSFLLVAGEDTVVKTDRARQLVVSGSYCFWRVGGLR